MCLLKMMSHKREEWQKNPIRTSKVKYPGVGPPFVPFIQELVDIEKKLFGPLSDFKLLPLVGLRGRLWFLHARRYLLQ